MSKLNSSVGVEKIASLLKNKETHIHFSGVGGVGMTALLCLSRELGYPVSGSDIKLNDYINKLRKKGIRISVPHAACNVFGAGLLVYSLALDENNPELRFAEAAGIPTVSRAELLGVLMLGYKRRIGISGTHGKSTSVGMLSDIFSGADLSPTVLIGADVQGMELPFLSGGMDNIIYEACEYKDSFLKFHPTCSLITNIELDHVDYFSDISDVESSFVKSVKTADLAVVFSDSEPCRNVIKRISSPTVSFGFSPDADYRIEELSESRGRYSFKMRHGGMLSSEISLKVHGMFNVKNAAGAYAVGAESGIPPEKCAAVLSEFSGLRRRLELLGECNGTAVYYDYAHHPTEIRETVHALKQMHGDVTVIFRPHTYSRTEVLFDGFGEALGMARRIYLLEIDAVREAGRADIGSLSLAERIGSKASLIDPWEMAKKVEKCDTGALVLMGAAEMDITDVMKILEH